MAEEKDEKNQNLEEEQSVSLEENKNTALEEENSNNEEQEENEEVKKEDQNKEESSNKKTYKIKSMKKALIMVIGVLLSLLLLGIILYSIGFFDKEEPKIIKKEPVKKAKQSDKYRFNINDINSSKLNKKLSELTNQNLISQKRKEELEKLENEKKILEDEKKAYLKNLKEEESKIIEKNKLLEEKKAQLEVQKNELEKLRNDALELKEQMLKDKENLEKTPVKIVEKEILHKEILKEEKEDVNQFLMMINVAKIHGELYKSYLDSILKINMNVMLCRDNNNRIEIYYGPFEKKELRTNLYNKLISAGFKEAYEVELTQEEFNKRCKY